MTYKNYLLFSFIILLYSCEAFEDPTPASDPPIASFTINPNPNIVADQTSVPMLNQSRGDIDAYFWNFEDGLNTSTSKNPSYTFDFEGARSVTLRVDGPGGTDERELVFAVHAFDNSCYNVEKSSSHSTRRIRGLIEDRLIREGTIQIKNDYSSTVFIELYDPENWLRGDYTWKYRYEIESGVEACLVVSSAGSNCFRFSNAWGIRLSDTSGGKSCVRTVGGISYFNNNKYPILASSIVGG